MHRGVFGLQSSSRRLLSVGVRRGNHGERRFGRGRGRGHHPSGLSGKEIGLYYASRGKERKRKKELAERDVVTMSSRREKNINTLLESLQTDDQPSASSSNCAASSSYDKYDTPMSMESEQEQHYLGKVEIQSSRSDPFHGEGHSHSIQQSQVDPMLEFDGVDSSAASSSDFTGKLQNVLSLSMSPFNPLIQDPVIDHRLKVDLNNKRTSNKEYIEMQEFRKKLPSYNMKEELLDLINKNQVVVISGETGCGKTTQVAQFILDHEIDSGKGSLCRIACTQPRRISAISVAERVASEQGEPCGDHSAGYQIRLDSKLPRPKGSIVYCTTGVLLRWLVTDRLLSNVSHVIIDEIHERDLMSDFLLIIIKDILPTRPDLKLILMSATLNAEMFSSFFGGCPMANIPGFTYPVKEFYIEDVIEMTRYQPSQSSARNFRQKWEPKWKQRLKDKKQRREMYTRDKRSLGNLSLGADDDYVEINDNDMEWEQYLEDISSRFKRSTVECIDQMSFEKIDVDLVVKLIVHICSSMEDGAILVFLPGWSDITNVHDSLKLHRFFSPGKYLIIPLHSMMPTTNQREVFERPPTGVRKIVLATNIAETSITIDDVVFVVDCGKVKERSYDATRKISSLTPAWISKASSKQRRGRAGRVQSGFCFHLFTELKAKKLIDFQLPEMLRTPLEEIALQIKMLKLGMVAEFLSKALEPPSSLAVQNALDTLRQLNALDANENLTPLGYHLATLPVNPRIGKMILFGAIFSCLDPVLTIASTLGFKDPFVYPLESQKQADKVRMKLSNNTKSDHLTVLFAYEGWEKAKELGNEFSYCHDNFLSKQTLKMVSEMKVQFSQLLCDIGFLDKPDPKDPAANHNKDNVKLIKAVLCAGLYPNVVKILHHDKLKRPPRLSTEQDGKVAIHPKSVNVETVAYENNWLIYHEKIKSTKIFLHDTTMIAPYPLLFFGGDITVLVEEGQEIVAVDDFIRFRSPRKIAVLVQELRAQLDKLLERKVAQPSLRLVVDSSQDDRATQLLHAIIDLITTEDSTNWKRLRAIEEYTNKSADYQYRRYNP